MRLAYAVLLGQAFFSSLAHTAMQLGASPLCSCTNPIGVCAILCMKLPNNAFSNAAFPNQMPALNFGTPQLRSRDTNTSPKASVLYLPDKLQRYSLGDSPLAQAFKQKLPTCIPVTVKKTIIATKTKTRLHIKAITLTQSIIVKNTEAPVTRSVNVIRTLSVPVSVTKNLTKTVTQTITIPAVTQSVTLKSLQMVTPLPATLTETASPTHITHTYTNTITITEVPRPVTVTATVTESSSPSAADVQEAQEYVDIKPLKGAHPGVAIEFHNSQNKVKTVNVVMSRPEEIFSPRPSENVAHPEPEVSSSVHTTSVPVTITNVTRVLHTQDVVKASAAPPIVTSVLMRTVTITEPAASTLPQTVTLSKTVTFMQPRTFTATETIEVTRSHSFTATETVTSKSWNLFTVTHTHPQASPVVQTTHVHPLQTIAQNKGPTSTIVKEIPVTETRTVTETATATITEVAPKVIMRTYTQEQPQTTKTVVSTVYHTITQAQLPLQTVTVRHQEKPVSGIFDVDKSDMRTLSNLRAQLDSCQNALRDAHEGIESNNRELDRLNAFANQINM
ncbi:hypothetical protein NECID01_0615 [Nematocida sp. AWRm77]|nr:hypothetical protein NECID01_0615 [Nematocida sp. AWRm77]